MENQDYHSEMNFFLDDTIDPRVLECSSHSTTLDSNNTDPSYVLIDQSYSSLTMPLNDFSGQSPSLGALFNTPFPPALSPQHVTARGPHLSQSIAQGHGQEPQPMLSTLGPDFARTFEPLSNVYQPENSIGQGHTPSQQFPAFESTPLVQQGVHVQIQANPPSCFASTQYDGISQRVAHALRHLNNPVQPNLDQQARHANKNRVQKPKRKNDYTIIRNSPILQQIRAAHGGFAHYNNDRLDGSPFIQPSITQPYSQSSSDSLNSETLHRTEKSVARLAHAYQSHEPVTLSHKRTPLNNASEKLSANKDSISAKGVAPRLRGRPRNLSPPVSTPAEEVFQDATATTIGGADEATAEISSMRDYKMCFSNFGEAKLHYNHARWQPAIPDDTIPTDDNETIALARRLMLAMLNTKGTKDFGSSAYKHWVRAVYPLRDVESVAFEIVHEAYLLHTRGSTLRVYNFKNPLPADAAGKTEEQIDQSKRSIFADEELNFEERMSAVIDHLTHWKSTCDYAMTGEKISWFVNAPLKYDHKVATNQRGNRSRAVRNRTLVSLSGTSPAGADNETAPAVPEKRKRGSKAKDPEAPRSKKQRR
ncbi:hypothetical protein AOQ84DRAFT_403875 [Glonium stellatum]|uniref:Uncharacterized protein n=1 Tax=Glonium stellatum TaxID=574774 RepID=A0A8E2F3L1_9PEZI|nr:hypothetical protein AOQ84DRAFT_403875 [Glonium stellatum]